MEGKGEVKEKGYIYLASPYSDQDAGIREGRYVEAMRISADLLREKLWVYSPIVHCHELAKAHELPTDAGFWRGYNFAMLARAELLCVLTIPGWDKSLGVQGEVAEARRRCKIVLAMRGESGLSLDEVKKFINGPQA